MEEENYLKCFFCDDFYDLDLRQPRMIFDCGHSICKSCLEGFINSEASKFICP